MKRKVSVVFEDAITDAGSLIIDCEFCNRTHFATYSENDYEEGELEQLREKARQRPEQYEEHSDCDSISWGNIDGRQYVWGCSCDGVANYEKFIWKHRFLISQYLRKRIELAKKEVALEEKMVSETLPDQRDM